MLNRKEKLIVGIASALLISTICTIAIIKHNKGDISDNTKVITETHDDEVYTSELSPDVVREIETVVQKDVKRKLDEYTNIFVTNESINQVITDDVVAQIKADVISQLESTLRKEIKGIDSLTDTQKRQVSDIINNKLATTSVNISGSTNLSEDVKRQISNEVSSAVSTAVKSVPVQTRTITTTTPSVSSSSEVTKNQFNALNSTVTTIQNKQTTLDTQLTSLLSNVNNLSSRVDNLNNKVNNSNNSSSVSQSDLSNLRSRLENEINDAVSKVKSNTNATYDTEAIKSDVINAVEPALRDWALANLNSEGPVLDDSTKNEIVNSCIRAIEENINYTMQNAIDNAGFLRESALDDISDDVYEMVAGDINTIVQTNVALALDGLQAQINTNADNITALSNALSSLRTDVSALEAGGQITDSDKTAILNRLDAIETQIGSLDSTYLKVENYTSAYTKPEIDTKVSDILDQITTVSGTATAAKSKAEGIEEDLGEKSASLGAGYNTVWESIETLSGAVDLAINNSGLTALAERVDTLETNMNTANNNINGINTKLGVLYGTDGTNGSVGALSNSLDAIEAALNDIKAVVNGVEGGDEGLIAKVSALQEDVSTAKTNIATINNKIGTKKTTGSVLTGEDYATIWGSLEAIKSITNSLETGVTDLQSSVDTINTNLDSEINNRIAAYDTSHNLSSDIADIKASLSDINDTYTDINALATAVATNTSDVNSLKTRVGALESGAAGIETNASDISALTGRTTNLESRMDSAEGNISSAGGRLNTAENDINTIESSIGSTDFGDNIEQTTITGAIREIADNIGNTVLTAGSTITEALQSVTETVGEIKEKVDKAPTSYTWSIDNEGTASEQDKLVVTLPSQD